MSVRGWGVAVGAALVAVVVVASCQAAGPPVATSAPPAPTPTTQATATPSPTPSLAATTPTPTSTATANADPCASSTADDPATPPDAYLSPVAGGDPVKGRLGSFTYCDTAGDALPPRAENLAPVALGDPPAIGLSVPLSEGFVAFRAGYWPASEWQGDEIRLASGESQLPVAEAEFDGPPNGDWMLAVHLTFASGGDAAYYWHVTVP